MQRRVFLKCSSGTLLTGTLLAVTFSRWVYASSASSAVQDFLDNNRAGLNRQQWQALIAVQSHLFPAEADSPDAQDVNAATYLYNVLVDPQFNPVDRTFVKTGILEIQKLAGEQYSKGFIDLKSEHRERVLRQYEKTSQGSNWLNMILEYLMEALLTDPVYGGNPNSIGWQWLGHTPGFPRPPKHKRYFLL